MTETPAQSPVQIEHNVRIAHLITGEHVICNFGQIREEFDGEGKVELQHLCNLLYSWMNLLKGNVRMNHIKERDKRLAPEMY